MATIRGGEKFEAAMKELAEKIDQPKTLQVGFFEGATNIETGASIPAYAAYNNYGAPAAGIPPRPFFSNMVRDKSEAWPAAIAGVLKQTRYDVDATLQVIGEAIVGQLQDSIINGAWLPNKPATLARKKSSSRPLIDTKSMYQAAAYRIK